MILARQLLDALGPALVPAREVRYLKPDSFADLTGDELERAARSLRALSYSCQQGATLLERTLRLRCVLCRLHDQESGSDLCELCLLELEEVTE